MAGRYLRDSRGRYAGSTMGWGAGKGKGGTLSGRARRAATGGSLSSRARIAGRPEKMSRADKFHMDTAIMTTARNRDVPMLARSRGPNREQWTAYQRLNPSTTGGRSVLRQARGGNGKTIKANALVRKNNRAEARYQSSIL